MLSPDNTVAGSAGMRSLLRITPGKAMLLFFFSWIFAWAIGLVAIGLVGGATLDRLRISVVLQDLIIFILPVVITVLIAAWRPWRFIGIDAVPGWFGVWCTLFSLVVAIPAMNCIVEWNNSLHLPASLYGLETMLRSFEEMAGGMVEGLLGTCTAGDLIVSILVIGILTGIAEECFFRGGLQSLLIARTGNPHLSIWITAIIFSAIHVQFFGFVPRVLLGAFFGYLYWWSGSLWLAVIAHAFNNTLVVIDMWLTRRGASALSLNDIGSADGWGHTALAIVSFILAFVSVWYMWRHLPRFRDGRIKSEN